MATKKTEIVEPLVFVDGETGETVTIEFNRSIILRMEREGLTGEKIAGMVENAPMSTVTDLWYYGMLMHQPETTREEAEAFLFDNIGFDADIIGRLAKLFEKPYADMMLAQRKNSRWTMR